MAEPTIVVGGVPFGRNNVGDEAILDCQVRILRELRPDARLVVSTDDGATAARLGVETVPLVGFDVGSTPNAAAAPILAGADLWFWAGATGLSDYPETALKLLGEAFAAGVRTCIFGTGMNDEFNPWKYRLLFGPRHLLYSGLDRCTLGLFNVVGRYEHRKEWRTRRRIAAMLERVDLVVVRDEQSKQELERSGLTREVVIGADAAIILEPQAPETVDWPAAVRDLLASPRRKLGVCISAQNEPRHTAELLACLDAIVEREDLDLLFIPMNPLIDAYLMSDLHQRLRHRDRAVVADGRYEPHAIAGLAACMDVVVSSRLHLLILAANSHVPIIGLSRGTKVDNFVGQYGLRSAGTVDELDFAFLDREVSRLLAERDSFVAVSRQTRARMLARLDTAKAALAELLGGL